MTAGGPRRHPALFAAARVDVLQDFTDDRNRLLSIIETMIVGEGQGFGESTDDASAPDTGAAFGQDDSEFNIFNTDRQLAALADRGQNAGPAQREEIADLLRQRPAAERHGQPGATARHHQRRHPRRASRSGPSTRAAWWPRPRWATPRRDRPATQGMYSGAAALALTTNFQQSQDTLYALAGDTGGKALLDNNDLAAGHRAGAAGHFQLLHPRLLHHQQQRRTANSAASRSR